MSFKELTEFCAEAYGWTPEQTESQPFASIVEILEARASRMKRQSSHSQYPPGTRVIETNDLASLGIGRG